MFSFPQAVGTAVDLISIAICTYNRASSLLVVLKSLQAQRGVDWSALEIIVIDNNCTDNTTEVVSEAEKVLPLRYVREACQGLSHARNRALSEATGDWVLFTDDDVLLDEDWLKGYQKGLREFSDVSYACGRVTPKWNGNVPRWFRGEQLAYFDGLLVWCDKGMENRYLDLQEQGLVGASFAVRKDSIERGIRFRHDLGVNGKTYALGEETEFIRRLQDVGLRGAYIGSAHSRHPVDSRRLTLQGLYRHGFASGRAEKQIADTHESGSIILSGSFLIRGLYQLLKGRGDRARQCIIKSGYQIGLIGW